MTKVSFLPALIETGWGCHGLSPLLLYKGQGLAIALVSWRKRNATVFLRRGGHWQQPSSASLSEERAEEVVMTFRLAEMVMDAALRFCRMGNAWTWHFFPG